MQEIKGKLINASPYRLFIFLYLTIGTAFSMFLAWQANSLTIMWMGLFIFWFLPFIFQNQFRKPFTKDILFALSENGFQARVFDNDGIELESLVSVEYLNIEEVKMIESSRDDTAFLKFSLKNGQRFKYTLIEKVGNNEDRICEVFIQAINAYNDLQKNIAEKIKFSPPLFATRNGTILVCVLSVVLGLVIVLQLIYLPKVSL